MIHHVQKEKLKNNWGDKANSMACFVETRVYDPLSSWECYIYALNPIDEDQILCIINGLTVEVTDWTMKELFALFNEHGDPPRVDVEFKPRRASEIFKQLNDKRVSYGY